MRDVGAGTVIPYGFYDYPEEYNSAHTIEGNEILCNDNPIYCYGVRTMEDEGSYSPLFTEAFGYKLAMLVAQALAASNQKQQFAAGLYAATIKRAQTRDGQQNTTRRMRNRALEASR